MNTPCPDHRPWFLPPVTKDNLHTGCLCCSTAAMIAPLDMIIAVGFGVAQAWKGDELIYSEAHSDEDEVEYMTVGELEKLADADPEHDWRIIKYGPMHGETFQRQGKDKWVCVESNQGFA